jgi:hypothetical protein
VHIALHLSSLGRRAVLGCALSLGCGSIGTGSGGDAPIGMMLEASEGTPAVQVAALARPGGIDDGLVQGLASAIHGALRYCGADAHAGSLRSELEQGVSLTFAVERGRLVTAPSMTDASACLAQQLASAQVQGLTASRSLSLELRTPRGAHGVASSGSAPLAR